MGEVPEIIYSGFRTTLNAHRYVHRKTGHIILMTDKERREMADPMAEAAARMKTAVDRMMRAR